MITSKAETASVLKFLAEMERNHISIHEDHVAFRVCFRRIYRTAYGEWLDGDELERVMRSYSSASSSIRPEDV